jgi:hypothetical protein
LQAQLAQQAQMAHAAGRPDARPGGRAGGHGGPDAGRADPLTALGTFIAQWGPVLQQAPAMAPMVSELLKFALRRFRVGRQLEDVIDQTMDKMMAQGAGGPPQADDGAAQAKAADTQAKIAAASMKQQTDMAKIQQDGQTAAMDYELKQADLQLKAQQQQLDAAALARDPTPQVIQ